jgi:hypothetical protein
MKERPILRTIKAVPWIPYYTASGDPENPRAVVVAPCHGWIQVHINTGNNTFKLTHEKCINIKCIVQFQTPKTKVI